MPVSFQSLSFKIERHTVQLYKVRSATDVTAVVREVLVDEPQEVLMAVYLSTQNEIVAFSEVFRGTLDASLVHPREVFRGAILANAASVIVAHNHPSGDPTPSSEDRAVTRQLRLAGQIIGIPLLDHVVVGVGRYVSFAESGLLD